MKIGVISDTHIPDRAKAIPEKILIEFKNMDMIIHAGDLVDLNTLDALKSICPDVRAVRGNMDPQEVREKLPEKEIIKAGNYKIALMHGSGTPNKLIDLLSNIFENDNPDIIIFGHSHYPVNEKRGDVLFFNPGSATDKIFSPFNSYGIIEINDKINAKIVKL